ncbi:monothiol glutaredoxin-5 [Coprinopsis cinerea okayama7|uniref:Monothiol glutaredoxin-5, mitochondrial n=1 Tax=Coprinopsis cinerea (strain Okayama-7 / 130 / ATCC MYA-4618 / FGSC 9003) TaxID=240176 RepID=A8NA70_COPC7|nr:monothiol glutaredoxin-5 [Coprinopsis cinerea okayama7\|eukprot:XP_001831725.1 monothiol glutaredoxin-5 [Coprinopsis cinerea okayama7\
MFRTSLTSSLRLLRRNAAPSTFAKGQLTAYRYITQEARAQIQKAIEEKPVVLFMKGTPDAPQCGFSRAVVQILDMYEVPPEKMQTYNVLADAELRSSIKEFSEWPTIPQVYVDGEFIGGCDILLGMHQSGELETLLESKNVIPKVEEPASTPSSS